jgi:hypothetical protein
MSLLYALLRSLFGLSFRDPTTAGEAIRWLIICGVVPFASGVVVLVYRRLRRFDLGVRSALLLAPLAVLSTWLLPYGITVSNHVPAAFLLTAVYVVMSQRELTTKRCIAGGVLAGLLGNVDVVSGAAGVATIVVWLTLIQRKPIWVAAFVVPVLVLVGVYGGLNVLDHGSAVPAYFFRYGYQSGEGFHPSPAGLTRPGSALGSLWHVTFGDRGVFSYMPALLFSLGSLSAASGFHRRATTASARRSRRRTSAIVGAGMVLSMFAACVGTTGDYGGWAYGCRYLVPVLPIAYLHACVTLHRAARKGRRLTFALGIAAIAFGVVTSAVGAWNPWPVCFEGARTEARLGAGSPTAYLDDRARNTFLVNALCIAVDRGSPSADALARVALRTRSVDTPIARSYLERAFCNLGRPPGSADAALVRAGGAANSSELGR